jgi:hypothetical protein
MTDICHVADSLSQCQSAIILEFVFANIFRMSLDASLTQICIYGPYGHENPKAALTFKQANLGLRLSPKPDINMY